MAPPNASVEGKGGTESPPRPLSAAAMRPSLCRPSSLHDFTMERQIETIALNVLGHAQPDEDIDDLKDNQRDDTVVDEHGADTDGLVHDLHCSTLKQAGRAAVLLDS